MKRKAKAALRDPTFWIGCAVAGLGAVELGLKTIEASIPPLAYGLTNMAIGALAAIARVALAQLPRDDADDPAAG